MAGDNQSVFRRLTDNQPLLWTILALPGVWMLARYISGAATYGEIVSETGVVATQLLIVTLAITPIRLIFRRGPILVWLVRRRRDFGVATFCYAAGHLGVYLIRKADLSLIIEEAWDPWLTAGWAAMIILLAMALSSNDPVMRAMRRWSISLPRWCSCIGRCRRSIRAGPISTLPSS